MIVYLKQVPIPAAWLPCSSTAIPIRAALGTAKKLTLDRPTFEQKPDTTNENTMATLTETPASRSHHSANRQTNKHNKENKQVTKQAKAKQQASKQTKTNQQTNKAHMLHSSTL